MDDFPSNAHKSRARPVEKPEPDEKKVERVTSGEVIRRKKPKTTRFKEVFFGGGADVWGYVFADVLLPAAKDMVADAVSQGIERKLYGEARSVGRRSGVRPGGHTPYNRYSSSSPLRREEPRREISRRSRASHDFDEIVLATRAEAMEVLQRLDQLIERYETASVSDLYELVGVSGNYTDNKWGWTDLRNASVRRVSDGYLLDLPRPEQID